MPDLFNLPATQSELSVLCKQKFTSNNVNLRWLRVWSRVKAKHDPMRHDAFLLFIAPRQEKIARRVRGIENAKRRMKNGTEQREGSLKREEMTLEENRERGGTGRVAEK